jgi:hypothetical protein
MEQVALLSIILMIAFCEWREHKLRAEMSKLMDSVKDYSMDCVDRFSLLEKEISSMHRAINEILKTNKSFEEKQKELTEYVHKSSVDLGTIVQEYEINGIWLGKDRNKNIDSYEG